MRGRDLASTIEETRAAIEQSVRLPYDTHLEWAGEINELKETNERLTIIVPLTVLLIAFLVYTSVKSWVDTLIVLVGIPVAMQWWGARAPRHVAPTSPSPRPWVSSPSSASRCRTR